MEILTNYFELGAYTDKRNNIIDVSDKLPLFENGVIMGKPIDRLAEFEDFMEEQEFTSLEDLKAYIRLQSKGSNDLIQENQALKDRWNDLYKYVVNFYKNVANDKRPRCVNEYVLATCEDVLYEMNRLEKE